jgi:hypothetical protein
LRGVVISHSFAFRANRRLKFSYKSIENTCTAFPFTLVNMLELSPPLPSLLLLCIGGLSRLNTRAILYYTILYILYYIILYHWNCTETKRIAWEGWLQEVPKNTCCFTKLSWISHSPQWYDQCSSHISNYCFRIFAIFMWKNMASTYSQHWTLVMHILDC